MRPCALCGYMKGGAEDGERYCSHCDSNLILTRSPKEQAERRLKKIKRTEQGVHSPWSIRYWVSG